MCLQSDRLNSQRQLLFHLRYQHIRMRLFPQSRFPLELFAEKTRTDTDSDLTGLLLDRTRYGFLQRYVTRGGTAFRVRYEHSDLLNVNKSANTVDEEREDVADYFEASGQRSFQHHNLSFNTSVNRIDTLESSLQTKTSYSALRHSYRPSPQLYAEDLLTYNTLNRQDGFSTIDTDILQLSSYAFWRPRVDKPLRMNGTVRAVSSGSGARGEQEVLSRSVSGSLFANYDLTDQWLLAAGVGGTGLRFEGSDEYVSFQTARATYNSRFREWIGFEYGFFGRGELANDTNDADSVQSASAQFGYRLARSWMMGLGMLRLEWRQSISQAGDTRDFSATRLLTDGSVTWNRQAGNRTAMARVSAHDSRTWAQGLDVRGVEGDFQLVNAQLSVNQRFSTDTSLIGNVTLQTIREYRERMPGIAGSENGDWRPTATADLTFATRSLFGVRRLSFRSTLRFISDAFVPLMEPDQMNGRNNKYWENRLDYSLGRMEVRLIGRLNDIRGNRQLLTLVQFRRLIGDA